MSGRINAAAQDSNWARASREKVADRTIGGIAIGKNARNAKFEEGRYKEIKILLKSWIKRKIKLRRTIEGERNTALELLATKRARTKEWLLL